MVYQFGLRLAERSKSGGPSLGRSPDAHKQRRLDNQDQIQACEEIKGRHNFWSRALCPALFFARRFRRSMPSDLIRGSIPIRAKKTSQKIARLCPTTSWPHPIRSNEVSRSPPNAARI